MAGDDAALIRRFDAAMAASCPFEAAPRLAAAVSGGADSTALALLADAWARARGGSLLALVVDHGLRAESAAEAALVVSRLTALGIAARLLTITGLVSGSAIAARARDARYRVLRAACADAGVLHLLLGHHAADQAETMMIRVLGGSGGRGLAGMAAVSEGHTLRLLRPMLMIPPAWLRSYLTEQRVEWVEDPSNRDQRALRSRLRRLRVDPGGVTEGTRTLLDAARDAGRERATNDVAMARVLAARVWIRPEGFALLSPGAIAPAPLAELMRVIAGAHFAPSMDQVAALAAHPAPGTLWGVRFLPAGRLGQGMLLVREAVACAPPIPAERGVVWDGRFRLQRSAPSDAGMMLGALGGAAARLRGHTNLPAAVLRTLPALWRGNVLVAVPHVLYPDREACAGVCLVFDPVGSVAGAPFLPA